MKIVKIIGGLGNQMFQFALYKSLQARFAEERVLVDLHCFNGYKKHHGFEIGRVFGSSYEEATLGEVARVAYPYPNFQTWRYGSRLLPNRKSMVKEKPDFTFEPTALTRLTDTYYDGYWQHEEYFSDIRQDILQTFRFPAFTDKASKEAAAEVQSSNSVAIHIRRGDYTHDKLFHDICTLPYYERAIRHIESAVDCELFCIFSDDMDWCREHIAPLLGGKRIIYADWNTGKQSFQDIHLMSLCRHNIIANSSFSWWGAWLNENPSKIVVAPSQWMNRQGVSSPVPEHWTVISV